MQFGRLKRREFVTLLGGAVAWPFETRAQQPALPVIGFLNGASPEGYAPYVTAFRQGLKETGYVDGQNEEQRIDAFEQIPLGLRLTCNAGHSGSLLCSARVAPD